MSLDEIRGRYDVVIAGGRVAGAATALLLARQGLRVLVVDPVPPQRDALSTHALMRAGVVQLHRWGLLDRIRAAGTPKIRTTVFHYGNDAITIPIKASDGVDGLYAPRRRVLDPVLAEAAAEAGAQMAYGFAVADLVRDGEGRVIAAVVEGPGGRRSVAAELVVGADGVRSRVARLVDAPIEHRGRHCCATIYGYWPSPYPESYHWYFADGGSAGLIDTNDGFGCLFAALPADDFARESRHGLDRLHRRIVARVAPDLMPTVDAGPPAGRLRAFPGIPGFMRRSAGPGWALVGDAGYFKDPATAHGITDALRDAELLAEAVVSPAAGALPVYQERRDAVARGLHDVTDRIASFQWDLDEVGALHRTLNDEMNLGLDLVRSLETASVPI